MAQIINVLDLGINLLNLFIIIAFAIICIGLIYYLLYFLKKYKKSIEDNLEIKKENEKISEVNK